VRQAVKGEDEGALGVGEGDPLHHRCAMVPLPR
jgi:hypothetical protein